MVLLQSPLLYVLGGGFLAYVLYTRITLYLARKRMMKEYGCEPCPHVYNTDNIIGLNVIRETVNNANNRCALRGARDRFINQKTNTFHTRTTRAPMIATIEPENIKTILSLKFNDYGFGNRSEAFTPLLGDGIFNNDGEKWSRSRHLLRPNFVREQVADLESLERHFQIFLKHIPRDGRVVDLQPLFFKLTIDTATEFLFNHSTNSLRSIGEESENNDDAIFARAFNYAQSDILTRFRWAFLDFLRPNKEGKEAIRICHEYVEKFVDEAIRWRRERETEKPQAETEDDDTRYVFIRELAKQTDDKVRIRSELINILLAGRDTTASLLSNTFFELAKRPDVWAKLKAEVNMLEGKLPSYQQLKNMKYLKWCFNECKDPFALRVSSLDDLIH
jgi:cytochrome P450